MSLRLIDTKTLRFIEPTEYREADVKVPKYVILSHTWGQEEVNFQEMRAILASRKENKTHQFETRRGFKKIYEFCKLASSRSFSYAWIDTCCIDKSNLPELSEAINSMFRWYQNAAACYVWLADLQPQPAKSQNDPAAGLKNCRWFTRGWCLQELVAPKSLEFFNAQLESIGSMSGAEDALTKSIAKITRIPPDVLLGTRLISTVPVACRMSWAAKRQTTKDEDMAYCLLGIFDVSMPMLYGEGGRHAFRRLQEHIIQCNNDLSIFAFQHTFSGNTGPYYDFFATSPNQFGEYGDIIPAQNDIYPNPAFTLTNKGIYFRRLELQVDVGSSYSLRLNCKLSANSQGSRMMLHKVAPGIYARCADNVSEETVNLRNAITDEEAYIITHVTLSVQDELRLCEENAIRVRCSTHDLFNAMQVLQRPPANTRWDSCKMQFLTRGDEHFRGYLKFFPTLAQRIKGQEDGFRSPPEHVYLACGLEPSKDGVMNPWVRLYTTQEWRDLETKLGIMTGLDALMPDTNRGRYSSVVLGTKSEPASPIRIVVSIVEDREGEVPFFKLGVELTKASV